MIERAIAALVAAASPDPEVRRGRFPAFMREVGALLECTEVDHAAFAARTAPLVAAPTFERPMWLDELACRIDEGGEDDALAALHLRTELEVAREIYRDTGAAACFIGDLDDDSDDKLRARARRFGYPAPEYVPRSHNWWAR